MPAPNISQLVAQGFDAVHIGFRHANGWAAGYGKLDVANVGLSSGMRRFYGALTLPLALLQLESRGIRGDNLRIAQFLREGDADNAYQMDMSVEDLDIRNAIQGTNTWVLGDWDIGLMGVGQPSQTDTNILAQRMAQSFEVGSRTAPGWQNYFIMSNWITPLGDDQLADDEAGSFRFSGVSNRVTVNPFGIPILTNHAKSNGIYLDWFSDNPCMVHTFIGNNVLTSVVVDYTPVSIAKTKAFNALTGAAVTLASVTPGTKTITFSAAPASGVPVIILYEHTGY